MREWIGLQRVVAEVLKGYFSCWGVTPEKYGCKPQTGFPSLQHQSWQRNPYNLPPVKSSGVSIHQGEMAGDAESLLKGQSKKFYLQPIPWALAEGEQSGLEMLEDHLRLVAMGRELKVQPPGSLC